MELFRSGIWTARCYEEWAVGYYEWPCAPYCDFKKYTKCCAVDVSSVMPCSAAGNSSTPKYKKVKARARRQAAARRPHGRSAHVVRPAKAAVSAGSKESADVPAEQRPAARLRRKTRKLQARARWSALFRVRDLTDEERLDLESTRCEHNLRLSHVRSVTKHLDSAGATQRTRRKWTHAGGTRGGFGQYFAWWEYISAAKVDTPRSHLRWYRAGFSRAGSIFPQVKAAHTPEVNTTKWH